jgi:hypothetical protein
MNHWLMNRKPHQIILWYVETYLIFMAILIVGLVASGRVELHQVKNLDIHVIPTTPCHEEDQSCWDCYDMGNNICGPMPNPVHVNLDNPRR